MLAFLSWVVSNLKFVLFHDQHDQYSKGSSGAQHSELEHLGQDWCVYAKWVALFVYVIVWWNAKFELEQTQHNIYDNYKITITDKIVQATIQCFLGTSERTYLT